MTEPTKKSSQMFHMGSCTTVQVFNPYIHPFYIYHQKHTCVDLSTYNIITVQRIRAYRSSPDKHLRLMYI